MSETEIARFDELLKHLATKEDVLLLQVDLEKVRTEMQRLRVELVLWVLATNIAIGGALVGVMIYLNSQLINQFTFLLQHWRP